MRGRGRSRLNHITFAFGGFVLHRHSILELFHPIVVFVLDAGILP